MKNIQDIVSVTQINQIDYKIAYLDYQESKEEIRLKRQIRRNKAIESIIDDIDNSKEISEIDDYIRVNSETPNIGFKVFSKSGKLTSKISSNNIDDVYNEALQKIKSLCDKNTREIEKSGLINFGGSKIEIDVSQINDHQMMCRKILSRCVSCSSMIAAQGRMGPGHIAIMSNHLSSMIGEFINLKIIVDNSCGDSIYMFRKTEKDKLHYFKEPGLQLVYNQRDNIVYYEIVEVGNNTHKQFIRLSVIF